MRRANGRTPPKPDRPTPRKARNSSPGPGSEKRATPPRPVPPAPASSSLQVMASPAPPCATGCPRESSRPSSCNGKADLHNRKRPPEVDGRSEEHTSELQSLMRISYAVFCLKKKKHN